MNVYLPTQDIALLGPEDVVGVYRLIEELCDRGNNPGAWRQHLVVSVKRMFNSSIALSYLMSFSLDPANIMPKTLTFCEVGTNKHWQDYVARGDLSRDPVTPFIMERFGTDFTCTRAEWISDDQWYGSDFFREVITPSNWDHAIYSQVGIIRPGVVDGLSVARPLGAEPYTPKEVALLRLIHQELARLWRKHDPLDAHALPPRQRDVLEGIRRGESRKAIAERMGVSDHTVHTYEKALYDRANVSGRLELSAVLSKLIRPTLMP